MTTTRKTETTKIEGIEITISLNEKIEIVRSADPRCKGKIKNFYTSVSINGESMMSIPGWVKNIELAFQQTRKAFEGTKWAF